MAETKYVFTASINGARNKCTLVLHRGQITDVEFARYAVDIMCGRLAVLPGAGDDSLIGTVTIEQMHDIIGDTVGHACRACGILQFPMQQCSRCRFTHYCSVECQRAHWPSHGDNCSAIRDAYLQRRRDLGFRSMDRLAQRGRFAGFISREMQHNIIEQYVVIGWLCVVNVYGDMIF